MVPLRRTRAKEGSFGPDAVLDLPEGAHLRIKTAKVFPPRFAEENGYLMGSRLSVRVAVLDDFTEAGEDNGKEFFVYEFPGRPLLGN